MAISPAEASCRASDRIGRSPWRGMLAVTEGSMRRKEKEDRKCEPKGIIQDANEA